MSCEERETLIQAYLGATEAHRKASDSVDEPHSNQWSKATKETGQVCETTLAALKAHIREHRCLHDVFSVAKRVPYMESTNIT